jgi:hypothetical protein
MVAAIGGEQPDLLVQQLVTAAVKITFALRSSNPKTFVTLLFLGFSSAKTPRR